MALSCNFRRILMGSASALFHFYTTVACRKLFVGGLSRLTTDEKLKEAFSPFGQLTEAKVILDKLSGRSKGFAFVTYTTIEEAEKAREGMNAKMLDGWVIFVDPAKHRECRHLPRPEPELFEDGFLRSRTDG